MKNIVTIEQAELWGRVNSQMKALETEMSALSKKKPDGPINTFKLNLINEKLKQANQILTKEERPIEDFDIFSSDSMPTNSDVVIVLTQYLNRLNVWYNDHTIHKGYHNTVWNFEKTEENEETEGDDETEDGEEDYDDIEEEDEVDLVEEDEVDLDDDE